MTSFRGETSAGVPKNVGCFLKLADSGLCCYCRNLAGQACPLLRFHVTLCRYMLDHVSCRNLPREQKSNKKLLMSLIIN